MTISTLWKKLVKTGVFPKDLSKIIDSAFTVRNKSDYDDLYVVEKTAVVQQSKNAKAFLDAIETYLNSLLK